MPCPPTHHFRRSLTSPSVLKSAAPRSAADEGGEKVDPGRRITRNSQREEVQDGAQRGRKPARDELQRGRRSVTAGPLGGSVVRARERGSRTRSGVADGDEQALERWTLSDDVGAMSDDSLEAGWGSSRRDEVVGATADPALLPFDLGTAHLSLAAPPFFASHPLYPPSSDDCRRHPAFGPSSAQPCAAPHPSLLQPLNPLSLPARNAAPHNPLDTAIETLDSDWSPLFSPEHFTALHVSLHGAGGGARASSLSSPTSSSAAPTKPLRLSYDVPDEYDAWDAAARCVADGEAREDGGWRGPCAATVGRTVAARRRLEMVRVQLAG